MIARARACFFRNPAGHNEKENPPRRSCYDAESAVNDCKTGFTSPRSRRRGSSSNAAPTVRVVSMTRCDANVCGRENLFKKIFTRLLAHVGDHFLTTIIIIIAADWTPQSGEPAVLITINHFLFSIITVIALLLHSRYQLRLRPRDACVNVVRTFARNDAGFAHEFFSHEEYATPSSGEKYRVRW